MRRKDGLPKRRAKRAKPVYECGFKDHAETQAYISPNWSNPRPSEDHAVVSLFAGCGGLDLGLVGGFEFLDQRRDPLPFRIIKAVDYLDDAVATYRLNLGAEIERGDLRRLDVASLPPAPVLTGGFPCQDFSSSGTKRGFDGSRGRLYQVLTDYMAAHRPKVVLGENVPHLARLRGGHYLRTIIAEFEAQGYRFDVWDLYAPDYGLPQSRRRLFIVGVRDDLPGFPERPAPTHAHAHVPIKRALADLEPITGEAVTNQSQYFVATKASSGGGQGDHTNDPDKVAYCIRANARGRIQFHHHLPRRLTVRECARLQSFPDQFVFPFSTQRNMTLIGNAVPPLLGHVVGQALAAYLDRTEDAFGDATEEARRETPRYPALARAAQLPLFST
jgi:DNA (cytosine-5)-methyltransferase 1